MRARELSVGLLSSLCVHVALGIFGLGALLGRWENSAVMPEFKHGLSSIELNLVSTPPPEPEPETPPAEPEVISSEPLQQPPKEQDVPVPEVMLDEGVEQGDPKVTTDIKPSYPMGSRMRGEQGSATIRVWIDAAGRAKRAEVVETSGYPALDRAAIKAAKKAHFRDSKGSLVYSRETTVTFHFTLVD